MTLNEYIECLIAVRDLREDAGNLPVIYAKDAEGNGYHAVYFSPQLFKVEDTTQFYMDPVDTDENTPLKDFNCVIVN